MKNLVVIFGGKSTEHDISILTAQQVLSAVDKTKYNVIPIYITHNGKWLSGEKLFEIDTYKDFCERGLFEVSILPNSQYLHIKRFHKFKAYKKIDCAIISCHGKNGEDGTIQGLLELAQIPYTSSGVLGSSLGLDKIAMKKIFAYNKIPITKFVVVTKKQFEKQDFEQIKKIELPAIVKPNSLGSSIGISVCKNYDELVDGLNLAFMFDDKAIVERLVENLKEVNISVLGDRENSIVSITEEVINKGEFLTFDKKYLTGHAKQKVEKNTKNSEIIKEKQQKNANFQQKSNIGTKNGMQNLDRIMPANITKLQKEKIETLAKRIFNVTNSKGVVRIDFMINSKTGKIYANEINTIPGSFAFYLWERSGIKFDALLDKLVDIAINHKSEKDKLLSNFVSSVLNQNQIKQK